MMDVTNAVPLIVSIIAANTGTFNSEIVPTAIAVKCQRAPTATSITTSKPPQLERLEHKSKPP